MTQHREGSTLRTSTARRSRLRPATANAGSPGRNCKSTRLFQARALQAATAKAPGSPKPSMRFQPGQPARNEEVQLGVVQLGVLTPLDASCTRLRGCRLANGIAAAAAAAATRRGARRSRDLLGDPPCSISGFRFKGHWAHSPAGPRHQGLVYPACPLIPKPDISQRGSAKWFPELSPAPAVATVGSRCAQGCRPEAARRRRPAAVGLSFDATAAAAFLQPPPACRAASLQPAPAT